MSEILKLFETGKVAAINLGLPSFAEDLKKQAVPVTHVDWRPPAGGNKRIAELLEKVKRSQAQFQDS